jgi:hypothetical protein
LDGPGEDRWQKRAGSTNSAQHPTLHERVEKLESFTAAMADGVVDKKELEGRRSG